MTIVIRLRFVEILLWMIRINCDQGLWEVSMSGLGVN